MNRVVRQQDDLVEIALEEGDCAAASRAYGHPVILSSCHVYSVNSPRASAYLTRSARLWRLSFCMMRVR